MLPKGSVPNDGVFIEEEHRITKGMCSPGVATAILWRIRREPVTDKLLIEVCVVPEHEAEKRFDRVTGERIGGDSTLPGGEIGKDDETKEPIDETVLEAVCREVDREAWLEVGQHEMCFVGYKIKKSRRPETYDQPYPQYFFITLLGCDQPMAEPDAWLKDETGRPRWDPLNDILGNQVKLHYYHHRGVLESLYHVLDIYLKGEDIPDHLLFKVLADEEADEENSEGEELRTLLESYRRRVKDRLRGELKINQP